MIRLGYALLGLSWFLLGCYWCDIDLFVRSTDNFPVFIFGSVVVLFILSCPFDLPGEK